MFRPFSAQPDAIRPNAQRIGADISNIDVMPTIADVLGLESSGRVQGESFLQLIDGKRQTHRDAITALSFTVSVEPLDQAG